MVLSKTQREKRKHKNIGVGANPPENICNDIKCPWHGNLALRGRIFVGKVISAKANKTAIVEWGYHRYLQKYERYERRHTRVVAYSPLCIEAKEGDIVRIMECRPISKTKSFAVIEVLKK